MSTDSNVDLVWGDENNTPINRPDKKRPCTEVSQESDAGKNLLELVQSSIADALKNSIPDLVEAVSIKLKATIEEIVKQAVSKIEDEMLQTVRREFRDEIEKLNVKALSETELLESYNRCENVRITGVAEKTFTTHDGKLIPERTETTMKTVLEISTCLEAGLQLSDISIAHRLPSRFSSLAKPIIVRFSRRVGKIDAEKEEGPEIYS